MGNWSLNPLGFSLTRVPQGTSTHSEFGFMECSSLSLASTLGSSRPSPVSHTLRHIQSALHVGGARVSCVKVVFIICLPFHFYHRNFKHRQRGANSKPKPPLSRGLASPITNSWPALLTRAQPQPPASIPD